MKKKLANYLFDRFNVLERLRRIMNNKCKTIKTLENAPELYQTNKTDNVVSAPPPSTWFHYFNIKAGSVTTKTKYGKEYRLHKILVIAGKRRLNRPFTKLLLAISILLQITSLCLHLCLNACLNHTLRSYEAYAI